jgi:ABC-type transporter Mla maintaining outer membrane lipid asymmetry permease subunit MlaE
MHEVSQKRPGGGWFGQWLNSLGMSVRLFFTAFSARSFRNLSWDQFRYHCRWMEKARSRWLFFSAAFISMALTSQAVLELQRFGAEDLARPLIALGLLRELGPLTVSIPP